MSNYEIGVTMFGGVLAMLALRVPVAVAMLVAGGLGYAAILGWGPLLANLKTLTFSRFSNYNLSIIPLFLLMGEFATKSGMSAALFRCARAYLGHRPGGLAMATIGGCAAFGALCGSSIATAATMSHVAGPEMRRNGYSGALTTGTLAGGGTLGILIPPSVILVIYALYTEQSIGALFVAAIVPGLMAVAGYMAVIWIYVKLAPASAPTVERFGWRVRWQETRTVWPAALVFFIVVGGIYNGWFSPTEAAAIGAVAVGLLGIIGGTIRMKEFGEAITGTAITTAFIFLILLGAELFSSALALTRMPAELSAQIVALDVPPLAVVVLILCVYIVLGCVLESLAMVLLTLPIFIPVILALDLGMSEAETMIWLGILILIAVELGMISPPFGLNLFVINAMAKDVPMGTTYRGVAGFCISDILRMALLVAFPGLTLWLTGVS
ncbi:TRAP transporter large permease [Jannaschia seohaensis]|uniref:TRAP transporter, DctM subunit n=1 Tax=Jannaschia seohaensis TaxID=475081 RepID=A0A2Y9C3H3_9RHOB|nr:TRAP transporter large permease [Jannaschia seohaensis]PWJ11171.1 tripartite ATP-independent transporter DctM subunit [Jannaschia seohaensis]SSA51472.1 TRAP transporter, DctM subunit [Jannaschia seohaensis]